MKILVLSDLHLEFKRLSCDPCVVASADVVVLAGDIDKGTRALTWISETFPNKPVVYVAGNHEFYDNHWDDTLIALRAEADDRGILFLEQDEVKIGSVRFLGCTLWTDFALFRHPEESMRDFAKGLNDCVYIRAGPREDVRGSWHKLTPQAVLNRHTANRVWLANMLEAPYAGKTVVVTHHLPSSASVPQRFRSDPLSPGYASELPAELLCAADLWIHGHSHDSCDYIVNCGERATRVVCNPRGYPARSASGSENPLFRGDLVIHL